MTRNKPSRASQAGSFIRCSHMGFGVRSKPGGQSLPVQDPALRAHRALLAPAVTREIRPTLLEWRGLLTGGEASE